MKTIITSLSLVALASASPTFAQIDLKLDKVVSKTANTAESLTVTGKIVESEGGAGIDLANVVLMDKANEKMQFAGYTDESGTFSIHEIPAGDYKMAVYFIGYKTLFKEVTISTGNVNLGEIALTGDGKQMKEFVVTDFKKVIEQRPDGISYNVENDKSAQGTSATDVLRKVPMVTVDMEGNVQLRGDGNIKVLVDGKPSELLAASVKDVLRQIPADNIKNIEVLTSPGAKYEGEGASGVINIITKKKMVGGFSGMIFAGPSVNLDQKLINGHVGTNLNYRSGKWGINTSFGISRWSMVLDTKGTRTDFPGAVNETQLQTQQHMFGYGNFGWAKVGFDYQIDSLKSFQVSANYNPGAWNQDVDLDANYAALGSSYNRLTNARNPRNTIGVNAGYSVKSKKKEGRTLDVLTALSFNDVNAGYTTVNTNTNTGIEDYSEKNKNNTNNNELTLQADYVEPMKQKGQKMEFGLKAINRAISSDFNLMSRTVGQTDYANNPSRSGALDYNQFVGAAYGQITTPLSKKLSMVAGARYEGTYINGDNKSGSGEFTLPMFHSFLPNVVFMYDLGSFNKLKISYNKRINRPSIAFVNPYIDYSDPLNLKQGNVDLDPERTHNFELGYSTFVGRTSLNASVFHRITNNAIEQKTTVGVDGVSLTTYGNIAKASATGLDLFGGTTLFRKIMLNINGSLYYKDLRSTALNKTNTGWEYSGNMFANYQLTPKYSINGFAMYKGNQVMLQGMQGGWYYYFLGAQVKILKGQGQLGIAAENFLSPKVQIPTRLSYINATQNSNTDYLGRGVRVSFNWSFGKMKYAQDKKIENDDLKESNDGQMGGGMGGGGKR